MGASTAVPAPGFQPVIRSLLDTDLYKFTMQQAMLHRHPEARGVAEFVCRSTSAYPLAQLARDVDEQLDWLCELRLEPAELAYLGARPYFKPSYIDFLEDFRLKRRYVTVQAEGESLRVRAEGPMVGITLFEIHVLATINELYFRRLNQGTALTEGRRRLDEKVGTLRERLSSTPPRRHPFEFFDFGTRRRFSREWHEQVVATLARELPQHFRGTSNVHLAMRHGLTPIGTMAHEYLQMYQGLPVQLRHAQKQALEDWAAEYRGDLGIALTDVIGMDAFLRDFDLYLAKLFDGLRHDSGDPFSWGDKALAHYRRLRIDPHAKRLVFSDALDFDRALALYERFGDEVQTGYGIGTWLTNDVGLKPLNTVMKLVSVNGQPVAKISDTPGKTLCRDLVFLRYLAQVHGVDASFVDRMAG